MQFTHNNNNFSTSEILLLQEEILKRSPSTFDLEVKLFNSAHATKKITKKEFFCRCGVMSFSNTNSVRFYCATCGEFKKIAMSEDVSTETKDYSTGAHCQIWLNRLQGKDIVSLSEENKSALLAKARARCTVANRFQRNLVPTIRCDEIRIWLRALNLTQYNKNVAAIHRIITRELGFEIIPPQFTMEEEKQILEEWNRVAEQYQVNYRKMKQSAKYKTNNPYYPICIYFIVEQKFPNDLRVAQLREYIHKQSVETMELRKRCWERTITAR